MDSQKNIVSFPTALEIKRKYQPLTEKDRVARNIRRLATQNSDDLFLYMVANDPGCRKRREEAQKRYAQERQRRERAAQAFDTVQHSLILRFFNLCYLRRKGVNL